MFSEVKPLSKYLQFRSIRIFDPAFTLHSNFTVVILLTCSVLVSTKQYFGEPMQCLTEEENTNFINSFCWTMGTYILNITSQISSVRDISVGVGTESQNTKRIYLRYYQWVVMVYLLEALCFYLPSFLWNMWEEERLKQLCSGISGKTILPKKAYSERINTLVKYFTTDHKDKHFCYSSRYILCHWLNLSISIINMVILDVFLNGFWVRYLDALLAIPFYDWNKWNSVTSLVFPKVAKCELLIFGPGGSVRVEDMLCMLQLNILNEKIFAFLWCWFIFVAFIGACSVLYYLFLVCSKRFRLQLLRTRTRHMTKSQVISVLADYSFGDWFMLYKVGSNVNPILFQDFMLELYKCSKQRQIEKRKENGIVLFL
ncbi:innexin inx5-like [Teleopsis dalmanni]|uniref:innexin inx5-like n=1 Tax=Teleopsis dalmanni TaxID=139649 RepID=UPI0018CD066C|nr:innexin inx5-like [Teleopsis dalmanni]